ncbi:MAG: DNA cytosine methyltransferase [Planctomycetaceae bacterium]|nr:DNA cytosine methyltransferase [Planctomycetaceae bacterium]
MALHSIKTFSICTGLGGIERGLERVAPDAFEPVLYCEREITVAAIIAKEIETGGLPPAPIWSDVKTVGRGSVARYLDKVGVDAITGGYPCQPFSVAGKRRGKNDPRHLWPWIVDAIKRFGPTLCFFENVAGHLVSGFEEVGDDLERLGFRVAAGLFTAAEVGATHRRERLFILGMADSGSERPQGDEPGRPAAGPTRRSGGANLDDSTSLKREDNQGRGRPEKGAVNTGGKGDELENAQRAEPGAGTRQESSKERGRDRLAIPGYPPGPGDAEQWRRILERFPELSPALEQEKIKPAFRGVADGLSRSDQLRAYGNAVVPDCAAVAFLSLFGALYDESSFGVI